MFSAERLPYLATQSFSRIVTDYLAGAEALKPFYRHTPGTEGIRSAITTRQAFPANRRLLAEVLEDRYRDVQTSDLVRKNIEALRQENSFTINTAHQPNLLTGPLYFIYKILHVIRIADDLNEEMRDQHFIPVYYMGSEDADLAELNHFTVQGKKYEWDTRQQGAVGRMRIDRNFTALVTELEGQLAVEPAGKELLAMIRATYKEGRTIQEATFLFVNQLFQSYGLVVLIADDPRLKNSMQQVFEDDLFRNIPSQLVSETCSHLEQNYPVQANPRDINLFYLRDDLRNRIEKRDDRFVVTDTEISFSEDEMRGELRNYPGRFSPNVILRGLYQETILPGVAFIGGGGELAYWLQLRDLFDHYHVPFPVLALRNSFMMVPARWNEKLEAKGFTAMDLFRGNDDLSKLVVEKYSTKDVSLNGTFEKAAALFDQVSAQAAEVDPGLAAHVAALKTASIRKLRELEKKMLRAEKRKFSSEQEQLLRIRAELFPGNMLQERIENFTGYYAKWGRTFINELYRHSPVWEQQFTILTSSQSKPQPE